LQSYVKRQEKRVSRSGNERHKQKSETLIR